MERLGDIYYPRDFPVLAAIARWEEQGRRGSLEPWKIAEEIGRPREHVVQSLGRLCHAGLVDCVDVSTHGGEGYIVKRLTAAGLQESGLWPKPADLSDALAQVLKREIQATASSDPERSRKLQVVLDNLSEFGSSFLAKLAAELLQNLGRH